MPAAESPLPFAPAEARYSEYRVRLSARDWFADADAEMDTHAGIEVKEAREWAGRTLTAVGKQFPGVSVTVDEKPVRRINPSGFPHRRLVDYNAAFGPDPSVCAQMNAFLRTAAVTVGEQQHVERLAARTPSAVAVEANPVPAAQENERGADYAAYTARLSARDWFVDPNTSLDRHSPADRQAAAEWTQRVLAAVSERFPGIVTSAQEEPTREGKRLVFHSASGPNDTVRAAINSFVNAAGADIAQEQGRERFAVGVQHPVPAEVSEEDAEEEEAEVPSMGM